MNCQLHTLGGNSVLFPNKPTPLPKVFIIISITTIILVITTTTIIITLNICNIG